ncbi:MAG: regulatory protein RecX [Alphaproteobacteria bacterium]|nr:regulatory protein RecX [Alphaproteobacteria bacterium]
MDGSGPRDNRADPGKYKKPRKRGPLKKLTLERSALHYLGRYASTVEGLRRVLARRVEKAAREERCDRDEASAWVEEVVARFAQAGLVDDRSFAEGRVASLRRRGESARKIAFTLREKGVEPELIAAALAEQDGDEADDAEFAAACRLAQRRRLGAIRPEDMRRDMRDRDLAALARAGFSFGVARRVLAIEDPETLEAAARGRPLPDR